MSDFLVIGYGNTLRRDDGAGPWVVERVAALLGQQVCCVVVQQLLPELAVTLAQAKKVVFVDAQQGASTMQVKALGPSLGQVSGTHTCDPAALLALAAALYEAAPQAWLVTIPAADFSHGEGLTPLAQQGAEQAVQWMVTVGVRLGETPP